MSTSKKSRSRKRDDEKKSESPKMEEALDEVSEHDRPTPVPEAPTPTPVAKVIPIDKTPKITAQRFARGLGALGGAFLATEATEHRLQRKKTRAEWDQIYRDWMAAPRG